MNKAEPSSRFASGSNVLTRRGRCLLNSIYSARMIATMMIDSRTSQYGSMTRGWRFADIDLKRRMREALEDIRSGAFAAEWQDEQRAGAPRFEQLRSLRQVHPLNEWEAATRAAFRIPSKKS